MKQSIEQVMEAGALGVKIECAGRLGGAEIARSERLFKGKLPLHTCAPTLILPESQLILLMALSASSLDQ
jgi:ribosomal protein S3